MSQGGAHGPRPQAHTLSRWPASDHDRRMSTPGSSPEEPLAPDPRDGATTDAGGGPPPQAPRRHNVWRWIALALAVAAIGLLVWAISAQSDLNDTEDDLGALQSQVDQGEETGSAVVAAAKNLYDDLAQQLGTTTEELAATAEQLAATKQDAAEAEQDAASAEQAAEEATSATDKAQAEADRAEAEVEAAQSKAAIAADCASAYVSAFGALLEGDDITEQAAAVREQLQQITADCRTALGSE